MKLPMGAGKISPALTSVSLFCGRVAALKRVFLISCCAVNIVLVAVGNLHEKECQLLLQQYA